jgi:hypothetical protein
MQAYGVFEQDAEESILTKKRSGNMILEKIE